MSRILEKVTAFVTRPTPTGRQLLLFQHPNAGIQIPAGTVEDGETPKTCVLREANEETGLAPLTIERYLGSRDEPPPEGYLSIATPTKVYARPDETSFDWAHLRKGIPVRSLRKAPGFTQVSYEEHDCEPDPQYITYCITGWVPDETLTEQRVRHFFHLKFHGQTQARWEVFTDNHTFTLFWTSIDYLPKIIAPQDQWLAILHELFPPR